MDDYRKLNKQPLKFVLAEFRFSPVMEIVKYIPKFQEALRRKYPISETKSEQAIEVRHGGIAVSTIESWDFITSDKQNAVEINQERLIYCTAAYPRFNGFSEACEEILKVLIEVVEPSLLLRIGLRYSDLIMVGENEKISTLVDSHFVFPTCVSTLGKELHQRSEAFIKTDLGNLAIRTLYGHHDLSCLPDIQGLPINIKKENSLSERIILDFDHIWESKDGQNNFEINEILNKLSRLHEISREAFWKITTEYARSKKWT